MSCLPIFNMNNTMPTMYNCGMPMVTPTGMGSMTSLFAMQMQMPMQMPIFMPMMNPFMNLNIGGGGGSVNNNNSTQQKSEGIKISKPGSECNLGSVSLSDAELKEIGFKSKDQRNRWSKLTPKLQKAIIELAKYAKERGIDITIISSWRSNSEQASLAKRKPGVAAKAGSSPHEKGLAIDIRVNGNRSKNLAILGAKWESMGYRWGKHWKGWTPEDWHFDVRPSCV